MTLPLPGIFLTNVLSLENSVGWPEGKTVLPKGHEGILYSVLQKRDLPPALQIRAFSTNVSWSFVWTGRHNLPILLHGKLFTVHEHGGLVQLLLSPPGTSRSEAIPLHSVFMPTVYILPPADVWQALEELLYMVNKHHMMQPDAFSIIANKWLKEGWVGSTTSKDTHAIAKTGGRAVVFEG